ncbi:pyridoxine 4-dehydrogenase, partial [Lecanoromycetidae sp. Uapishka_2]
MPTRVLGKEIGEIGFGLLGLTLHSTPPSEEQCFATMRTALAAGCNLWNGGEFYGPPDHNSMTLLKKYFERYPEDADKVVLNVKGATKVERGADGRPIFTPDGSREYVRKSVLNCLEMLGPKGRIDMFESARRDHNVPLKETLIALAEFVDEGKIGGVALSEVNAATIREAAKITKILAVEVELSLWSTEPLTDGIAKACAELKIPIHAYSPLGRGMLAGQFKSLEDLPEKDFRRMLPRFQPESFKVNIKLVEELEKFAQKRKCKPSQLALGWLLSLSKQEGMPEIIPIPGATTVERVKENSVVVMLSDEEMKEIDEILGSCDVIGDRYHAEGMKHVNG